MKLLKCSIFLFLLTIFFTNIASAVNSDEITVKYFLIYDWIADEALFEIQEEDITLYPFLIQQTKGKNFTSYKAISLWNIIGYSSSNINISSLFGFKSSYETKNNKSIEFEELGNFVKNRDLYIKKKNNSYIAETIKGNFKATSTLSKTTRTLTYLDSSKNEIKIEIDSSKVDTIVIKKYINNQLSVYGSFKKDLSNINIYSLFAEQKIIEYKKSNNTSSILSLGTLYNAKIKDNTTYITTTGRTLMITKDLNGQIISYQLISAGKTRYTEDIKFFEDYILITKFDVVEGIYTEVELGYDQIVLFEERKNIEDTVFYKYEHNPETKIATLEFLLSGNLICTHIYSFENGIKELKEIKYSDENKAETIKKIDNFKEKVTILRDSKNIFTLSSTMNYPVSSIYDNIKSSSSNIKKSDVSKLEYEKKVKKSISGLTFEYDFNPSYIMMLEKIKINRNIDISRTFSHTNYSYNLLNIKNGNHTFKSERQFRAGIGQHKIINPFNRDITKKYNSTGRLIAKKTNIKDKVLWNSLYGYKDGKISVIRDMINGALAYITLFRYKNNETTLTVYDMLSNRVKDTTIIKGLKHLIIVGHKLIKILFDELRIEHKITNNYSKVPLIKNTANYSANNIEIYGFKLDSVSTHRYQVGKSQYKEEIQSENKNYIKYINDGKKRTYQKIFFNKNTNNITSIRIFGDGKLIDEGIINYNHKQIPKTVEFIRKGNKDKISLTLSNDYKRVINTSILKRELKILTGINLDELHILENLIVKSFRIFDFSENDKSLKTGNFIAYFLDKSNKYFIKYISFMPIGIYISDEENFINTYIYIKDFLPYAYQTYKPLNDNKIYSELKDTLGNIIAEQELILNSMDKIEKIKTDLGDIAFYSTEIKYNENNLIEYKLTTETINSIKYEFRYIYGENLNIDFKSFSINNTNIEANFTYKNKDGETNKETNYRYSFSNGLWYNTNDDSITISNIFNELVDKESLLPQTFLLKYYLHPKEFWWVFQLNL